MLNKIRRALGLCVHEWDIVIKYPGGHLYYEYYCAVFNLELDRKQCRHCKKLKINRY